MLRKIIIVVATIIGIFCLVGWSSIDRNTLSVNAAEATIKITDLDDPYKIAGYATVLYYVNRKCGNYDAAVSLLFSLADFYATKTDGGKGTVAGDRVHDAFIRKFLVEENIGVDETVIRMVAPSCRVAEDQVDATLDALEAAIEQMVGIEI